jgi:glucosamine--fructose-6-phosphate aminotransferase (isomerizing)
MCGIAAYIGDKPAIDFLLPALKAIEYRGYDSHGFLVCSNHPVYLDLQIKSNEPIGEYSSRKHKITLRAMQPLNGDFTYGLAHTRWATHGEKCVKNAHPITVGEVSVVHNGMLDNVVDLKYDISQRFEYEFKTGTDTEIIAFLINEALELKAQTTYFTGVDRVEAACAHAIKEIEKLHNPLGAFVASFRDGYIVAYSNGSPLIMLREANEAIYIASDVQAFSMTHAGEKAQPLPHGYLYTFGATGSVRLMNVYNKVPDNAVETFIDIEIPPKPCSSGGKIYPHHMKAEISQQPDVVNNIDDSVFRNQFLTLLRNKKDNGPMFVGCGSSYLAGKLGAMYWERLCEQSSRAIYASEVDKHTIFNADVIVPISQSGETKDVINAMAFAQGTHPEVRRTGIINRKSTTLEFLCNDVVDMKAGTEIGVAATKSFIATAYSILRWAYRNSGMTFSDKERDEFVEAIQNLIDKDKHIKDIAKECVDYKHIIVLGSGLNYPIASEAALKIKEISYIHAEAMPSNEVKHGPIALVDDKTLFIFLLDGDELGSIFQNVSQIKSRNGHTLLCGTSNCIASGLVTPKTSNIYTQPLVNSVAMQLFAYYLADFKGCDIDKPRNLAKSVTV